MSSWCLSGCVGPRMGPTVMVLCRREGNSLQGLPEIRGVAWFCTKQMAGVMSSSRKAPRESSMSGSKIDARCDSHIVVGSGVHFLVRGLSIFIGHLPR